MMKATTSARNMSASQMIGRRQSEFSYVPMHKADDALRLGFIPHGGLIGTPYEFDSIIMEWICKCPNPLERR